MNSVEGGTEVERNKPSESQQRAIEAPRGSLLVLAGPGAGKTFCLIERINYLIQHHGIDPARICAFTFTNKAAGEITHRLEDRLGRHDADKIQRGTIHAFCSTLLRELGAHVLLEPGFGIADEEYQLTALRRLEGYRRWHRNTLTRFSAHRFRGDSLMHDDLILFHRYEQFLTDRKLVDFDTLILKAAELLERPEDSAGVRSRWDVVLVDEFQDLNPVQYRVVRALARDHRHVFAVGDDEQSIYSWAGASPQVFRDFVSDLELRAEIIHLEENRRCPQDVFALARKLVALNPPIFENKIIPRADRAGRFPVSTVGFETDDLEESWIVEDIRRDREEHGHPWGDVALLYRKHDIGNRLEAAFLNAGIPCRLAQGRALSDDPVVAYVLAAARVIASPADENYRNIFFREVLPRALYDEALAKSEVSRRDLRIELRFMAARLPRADESARQIRRALADWKNLDAVGKSFSALAPLVTELLSRRVGKLRSVLDDRHDEITDPATLPDVVRLADRLRDARSRHERVYIPPMGGIDIPIGGMLADIGIDAVRGLPLSADAVAISPDDTPSVGIALGIFKATQLIEMSEQAASFTNFTAVDLETTDADTARAEIVEIAAVRVRDGVIVDKYSSLVKPRVPIAPGATDTHGIGEAELRDAPYFEDIWPAFRAFCGDDVIVAHNGYDFDFKIINRMARGIGAKFDLCTYDSLPLARDLSSTSHKLVDLARQFGIDTGQSHRALDDTIALTHVLLALGNLKQSRARKTGNVHLLDHLGVALALSPESTMTEEALMFRSIARAFSLGLYSKALDWYEKESGDDITIPGADEVIELLGGAGLMVKIRTVKTADQRYPDAMNRLRRLLEEIPEGTLGEQLTLFLERAVLSRWDGLEPERLRVNLLTLHSTKGLEFSRVYIVGAEDAQLPGGSPTKGASKEETEEARRLLYVGMTRTIDRLILTRAAARGEKPTGGHQFLDEMGLVPK